MALQSENTYSVTTPDTAPTSNMAGTHAMKLGTTLETTINRLLHPERFVHYKKVAQSTLETTAPTATLTEYRSDGTPLPTESLRVFKDSGTLPTDQLYNAQAVHHNLTIGYYTTGTTTRA